MLAANVIGTPVCSWEPGVRGSAAFSAFSLLTFLLDTVSAFDRSVIFKFREVRGARRLFLSWRVLTFIRSDALVAEEVLGNHR